MGCSFQLRSRKDFRLLIGDTLAHFNITAKPGEGACHVHNGQLSPDSRRLVYTRDIANGDIYEQSARR